ncbi:unnamed protein product [Moneuplotes crassus]|uniref:Uncharacterized protein n=1 Tax=Euplotes crassus TaxID=5936 RepID=A0AAD1XFA4_EUPCR|nr:unnamed protein product [Moneuplotes crassus]
MNSKLSTKKPLNSSKIWNEAFDLNSFEEIQQYWETTLNTPSASLQKKAWKEAFKSILIIEKRIYDSMILKKHNGNIYQWILEGIDSLHKYNKWCDGTDISQEEIEKSTRYALKILNTLQKLLDTRFVDLSLDEELLKILIQLESYFNNMRMLIFDQIQPIEFSSQSLTDNKDAVSPNKLCMQSLNTPKVKEQKADFNSLTTEKQISSHNNHQSNKIFDKAEGNGCIEVPEEEYYLTNNLPCKEREYQKSYGKKKNTNEIESQKFHPNSDIFAHTASNQNCEECRFIPNNLISKMRNKNCLRNSKNLTNSDDDSQSVMSDITKHTERSVEKTSPISSDPEPKKYLTRFSIRENKRIFGPRIKIREEKNTFKSFYKRRMVTTDFEFNPRFDEPKKQKRKPRTPLPPPSHASSFHMGLRKRQMKESAVKSREIQKQTSGILKPDPLKSKFW